MEMDRIRNIPQIGDDADLHTLRAKTEAERIDSVVRDGEAVDLDVADLSRAPAWKHLQRRECIRPSRFAER